MKFFYQKLKNHFTQKEKNIEKAVIIMVFFFKQLKNQRLKDLI